MKSEATPGRSDQAPQYHELINNFLYMSVTLFFPKLNIITHVYSKPDIIAAEPLSRVNDLSDVL